MARSAPFRNLMLIPFIVGFTAFAANVGIHFLTYKLQTGLYISFYFALIVAGILGMHHIYKQPRSPITRARQNLQQSI